METARAFRLRLAQGIQTIRLDEDSVDYDWRGQTGDFHGTLPYENLRLRSRVTRKGKTFSNVAVLIGGVIVLVGLLMPGRLSHYAVVVGGVALINLTIYAIRQHIRGRTICVQIEPRPFGFSGELPIPDTKNGQKFLEALEAAWNESLRRRFLGNDTGGREAQLQRINWLQFVGVLTGEEAAVERELIDAETQPEQKMIALN